MLESLKHSFSFLFVSSLNSILTTLSTAPLLRHWEILSRIFSEDYTQLTINTGVPFVTINTMLLHNYTIWLGYQISISCSFYAAVGFLGGSHNRRIGNNRLWTSRVQWSITFGWNEEDSNWKNHHSSYYYTTTTKEPPQLTQQVFVFKRRPRGSWLEGRNVSSMPERWRLK